MNIWDVLNGGAPTLIAADLSEDTAIDVPDTFDCTSTLDYGDDGTAQLASNNYAYIAETRQRDDATAAANCYRPSVTKTVAPAYTRIYTWTIDKSVDPVHTDLFEGDSTNLNYTVRVNRSIEAEGAYQLKGNITIANPNPARTLSLVGVGDVLDTGQALPVVCAGGLEISADDSITCDYGGLLPDDATIHNTAYITAQTGLIYASLPVPVDFANAAVTEVLAGINVTDTQPASTAPWSFGDSGVQQYSTAVTCDQNAFGDGANYDIDVDNTAAIVETGQTDSAYAAVTCWRLLVSKDAQPTYTQPYTWTIEKVVTPSLIELVPGQTQTARYTVTVAKAPLAPEEVVVAGKIYVYNPSPLAATVGEPVDTLSGEILADVQGCVNPGDSPALAAAVDAQEVNLFGMPAGSTLVCDYQADLPNVEKPDEHGHGRAAGESGDGYRAHLHRCGSRRFL
ncbi:MAG: hypothetical protein IPK16_25850 [Anaerolineales bacterium]|nr:hypothetical protein [Anaerolineales bacterium]